jgi:HEAT repeat protein
MDQPSLPPPKLAPELGGAARPALSGYEPALGGAASRERFAFYLLRKTNRLLYYTVTRILAERGSPAALDSLRAALLGGGPYRERHYAATALGWAGESHRLPARAIPDLIAGLTDPERGIREVCVWALIKAGSEVALPGLTRAIRHPSSQLRAQAALIIGEIAAPEGINALLEAVHDPVALVREAGARGLGRMGPEADQALEGLIDLLHEDESPEVRAGAGAALGSLRGRGAVPHLIAALLDEDPGVRAVAAETLGQLGDLRAVAGLIEALADSAPCGEDLRICDVAAESLLRIGTRDALEARLAWLGG